MKTTQPIRNMHKVHQLMEFYRLKGNIRNYVLITLSVYTALRVSDLLRLTCSQVYDLDKRCVRGSFTVTEHKTGKGKTVALNKAAIKALKVYMPYVGYTKPDEPLFVNKRTGRALSRIQAYRIIRYAAEALGFSERVSCHSLRKTFGYHAWKGGADPVVIMEIYNHSSISVTMRYLGITQDDINRVYLRLDFGKPGFNINRAIR